MNREAGSARSFRSRVRKTFDTASSFYGFFDFFSREDFTEAAALLKRAALIGPGTSVLEVFCATGLFSRILASAGTHVTAVDISPLMVRRARREASGLPVDFMVADAADLPFGDDSFDLVIAGRGLHGMPGPVRDDVVAEVRRICAGHVLFMEPKRPSSAFGRALMGALERLEGGYDDYLEFISTDFKDYLTRRGFAARDLMIRDGQAILLATKARPARPSARQTR
jgi:ubiquinone/menaquinone biosynthesis C-methylase UbiE